MKLSNKLWLISAISFTLFVPTVYLYHYLQSLHSTAWYMQPNEAFISFFGIGCALISLVCFVVGGLIKLHR
jgi:hypothetical protein